MKKFSLIVALLIALTVIFVSCGADYVAPVDDGSETFTDIPLPVDKDGKLIYNYFAGQPENQKGWATDGQSEVDKKAGKLGLSAEDFQSAKYLVLKLKEGGIKGGISVIWGGEPAAAAAVLSLSNAGWMSQQIVSDGGEPDPGKGAVVQNGNELWIELSKALLRYDAFISPTLTELKICIAYYQGVDNLVEGACLKISNKPPEFFPAKTIVIKPIEGAIAKSNIKLEAIITPETAGDNPSVQNVTWEIVESNLQFPAEVDFALSSNTFDAVKLPDTLYVSKVAGGKVTVKATLKNGALKKGADGKPEVDEDGKPTGAKVDVVSDKYEIVVGPNPFPPGGIIGATEEPTKSGTEENKTPLKGLFADKTKFPSYLVLVAYNAPGNFHEGAYTDSYATLQWVIQGSTTGWQQLQQEDAIDVSTYKDSSGFTYFVFDISDWDLDADKAVDDATNGYLNFFLNSWGQGNIGTAYKVFSVAAGKTLTMPGSGAKLLGGQFTNSFISKKLPVELSWEE